MAKVKARVEGDRLKLSIPVEEYSRLSDGVFWYFMETSTDSPEEKLFNAIRLAIADAFAYPEDRIVKEITK